jgi:hypothetical protein
VVLLADWPEHRHTFWILTETELKIVVVNHDTCFPKNLKQSGDVVRTIPLDSIIACGVDSTIRESRLLPLVFVDISEPRVREDGTLIHSAVGLGLTGHDWLAQEIVRRCDRLRPDVRSAAAPLVAPNIDDGRLSTTARNYEPLACCGDQGNTPNAILQWAQEHEQDIVAWTTLNPGDRQDVWFYHAYHNAMMAVFVLGLFFSLPMGLYMWIASHIDIGRFQWLLRIIPGSILLIPLAVTFATVNALGYFPDCYWVLTETHLWVLSKRHRLAIVRKIPLPIITQCTTCTRGRGRLDQWGASLPMVYIYTAGTTEREASTSGTAETEYEWFIQQVLNQRDMARQMRAA